MISIVVPVYRELKNGNLARLLKNIAGQAPTGAFVRLIAVVNNTHQIAAQNDHPTLEENRRTVRWLQKVKPLLNFDLEIVDETTGFERNMGKLRNRGLFRAIAMANIEPARHLIINFDADGTFPENYFQDLLDYYDNYAVDAVIPRRTHTIPDDVSGSFFQSHMQSMNNHLLFDIENVLNYPQHGYSTPQITFRASTALDLKGFAPIIENEDLNMGHRLKAFTVLQPPDIMVNQSDRAREDGFDAARRLRQLHNVNRKAARANANKHLKAYLRPAADYYEHLVEKRKMTWSQAFQEYLRNVKKYSADYWPSDTPLYHNETESRIRWIEQITPQTLEPTANHHYAPIPYPKFVFLVNDLINFAESNWEYSPAAYFYGVLKNALSPAEARRLEDQKFWRLSKVRDAIRARIEDVELLLKSMPLPESAEAHADPFRRHLRLNSPGGLRQQILSGRPDKELIIRQFPDFLSWEPGGFHQEVEILRLMIGWLLEAQINPDEYPGTNALLRLEK